ncbi:hypothetical protein T492DRAFT_873011 [Pavlovales sp. CCMP2436]|nr:hypothetical protein T492DRAFT_873011 [Pavlovales sp. CCMP2436]
MPLHKQSGGFPSRSPIGFSGGERTIKRSTFSPEQLSVLEEAFITNPLPNLAARHLLAEELGLTPRTIQVWFQNRRQKVKKLSSAAGAASTSNDTLSSAGERDSPRTGGILGGMPRNNSTASFELFNAEFDRLNRSPCPEPLSDAYSPSAPAHQLYPPARDGGDAPGWGRAAADGGTSLWTHDGAAERAVAHTFHTLLGARTGAGGFGAEAAGRSLGADLRAQHCLDAQHWLSGADPKALVVAGGLDTLDAAVSLLLFSATAALLNGGSRSLSGLTGVLT